MKASPQIKASAMKVKCGSAISGKISVKERLGFERQDGCGDQDEKLNQGEIEYK
ncbi:MAG: hypothetical protein WBB65_02520 [Anaerolineales bacterium]